MSRSTVARAALLVLFLLLTACGGATGTTGAPEQASPAASPSPTAGAPAGFPVTVEAANGAVTLDAPPESIVSLSPTATEMLFAIDAGDQTVAVDRFSTYPSEAPATDLSALEPNIEAIASYEPDLVVFAEDPGDLASSLEDLDIPAVSLPAAATLDDSYAQISQLGAATGHAESADAVVERMRDDIDEIVAGVSTPGQGATFYHELDNTYYSVTSDTFIGQLYGQLGLRNIADDAPQDAGGYPQLSSEFIVDANPELIFLADTKCCGQSLETVAQRPGWAEIDAVANNAVIELDDDIASRWGPRVVDLLRTIADAVETPRS
jgi:iron complex transport system substrate-binding protein